MKHSFDLTARMTIVMSFLLIVSCATKEDIEDLQNQISDIAGDIRSITYVPGYSDGAARVLWQYQDDNIVTDDFYLDFKVLPSGSSSEIASVWQSAVRAEAVYTLTRSLVDASPLTVKSVVSDGDFMRVTISGEGLKDEFFRGECMAGVSIEISNGNSNLLTECIPLVSEQKVVSLSASGTANCYIVTSPGYYTFSPYKGNSSETVGDIASAEVLWESFGTDAAPEVGDLISNVRLDGDMIAFTASDSEGNAVIAAKDASGNILWSWHIWMTDRPEDQVYNNGAGTMMDRNLGATSATPGDVGALGLLYQWGRKDPFLGSSAISESIVAKSTIVWPSPVTSTVSTGTIDYAVSNPVTFIIQNRNNYDWYYTDNEETDNTRWQSSKTIYDPCPPGYRVPDGGENGVWSKAFDWSSHFYEDVYDRTNKGFNFGSSGKGTKKLSNSVSTCWYPAAGFPNYKDGSLNDVGVYGHYWSCSPFGSGNNAFNLYSSSYGNVTPSSNSSRAYSYSVRCLKE